jgi:putative endonuclease
MDEWFVYLLLCSNDSLYCGIAKDPDKRFLQHQAGKGARYTRAHKAVEIIYREGPFSHGDALRRERAIKALSRLQKNELLRFVETRTEGG